MPAPVPTPPVDPDGGRVRGPVRLRYEDISQEGRLLLLGIPHALDQICWPAVFQHAGMQAVLSAGVIPIRARMLIEGGEGPVSALLPLRGEGLWHRAATRDARGEVDRLLLMMWVDLYGRAGWTFQPPDPDAPEILAGRVYVEHVFTRLWADPAERRVRAVDGWTPRETWPWRSPEAVAADPPDARRRHQRPIGLMYTDPNNHVNSLVYPRIFEEEAIALRGQPEAARRLEVVWRKPFFAGEVLHLEQWAAGEHVHGHFLDEGGAVRARLEMSWT